MISHTVLDAEIKLLDEQIASYKARNAAVPDELTDRRQEVKLKMDLLLIQVQTQQLSLPVYIEQLKKKIIDEKQTAIRMRQAGRQEQARSALRRFKLMEKEVAEVEEAQARGDL